MAHRRDPADIRRMIDDALDALAAAGAAPVTAAA
jgi:hypothetical protein